MVCEILFSSEFPDIPDNAGKVARRRGRKRRTQAIPKRYAFHANAIRRVITVAATIMVSTILVVSHLV